MDMENGNGEIEELWKEYFRSKSVHIRNLLVEKYLNLAEIIAARMHSSLPRHVNIHDLKQVASMRLMAAVEDFDPAFGVKFETYCVIRIRGAVLDEIREMDWVPRSIRQRIAMCKSVAEAMRKKNGYDENYRPTAEDIASHLDVPLVEAERIRVEGTADDVVHVNQFSCLGRNEQDMSVMRGRRTLDPAQMADPKSLKPEDELSLPVGFEKMIACLSDVEQIILTLYYRESWTMLKIGSYLSMSESRISQMHSRAIEKVKEFLEMETLTETETQARRHYRDRTWR